MPADQRMREIADMSMGFNTTAVHGGKQDESGYAAVNYPIFLSSTFCQPDTETEGEFCYSRGGNPTRAAVEKLAADVEGASFCLATASGMAATSMVFELLHCGDKLLLNNNVYGGTWRFVSNLFEQRGIQYEIVDDFNTYDFSRADADVKMVFLETPSNPLLAVTDIRRVVQQVSGKDILVVVDNTFMTAYLQRPLDLGADIVVYSATKYYAGHSDILAGLVITNHEDLYERLKFISNTLGGILSPLDAFLLSRGIRTLGVRMDRHQENAWKLASWLEQEDGVEKIYFPALADHPGHELHKSQASGFGAVISFLLKETYDMEKFVASLKLFSFAVSLGGVESLICRPSTMTHESYTPELQRKIGIHSNLLRISVGLEDAKDLIDDLEQAFRAAEPHTVNAGLHKN